MKLTHSLAALITLPAAISVQFVVNAQSATVTYEYDAHGRLILETNPEAGNLSFEYDDAHNRVSVDTPSGMVPNQAPVASDQSIFLSPGQCTNFTATYLAYDPDGDPITFTNVTTGSIYNNNTQWYFCVPNSPGSYGWTYTVSDDQGATDTGELVVWALESF
ncbi:Ig-like domain-containing protein [Ponticaulis koreensis]|uniref:Ig-like domain-containing protein n=1 Tax=Ponticaulis koreensis TaxID=1123045 RepID=UPI0003B57C05|nr:Ig-like domain-containing protein [Ponticaulis koreensis]